MTGIVHSECCRVLELWTKGMRMKLFKVDTRQFLPSHWIIPREGAIYWQFLIKILFWSNLHLKLQPGNNIIFTAHLRSYKRGYARHRATNNSSTITNPLKHLYLTVQRHLFADPKFPSFECFQMWHSVSAKISLCQYPSFYRVKCYAPYFLPLILHTHKIPTILPCKCLPSGWVIFFMYVPSHLLITNFTFVQ